MMIEKPAEGRQLKTDHLECDLAVVGGGLAGACCAITAARAGVRVVLIGDRPVLGGNASSEVRLWTLGATSHMGNNNRWAREGGVIDEILVENTFRNPEGNPCIFDTVLLEKVMAEPNITLLLNTAVFEVAKGAKDSIRSVRALCSQNSTLYEVAAPLFCDASGDGVVGYLAGAAYRIGAESREELGEQFAPPTPNRQLLGHTIYFYSKDAGRPVTFVPPAFALSDITKIPRWRDIRGTDFGCRLWWLEWGGELDTIHQSETIKWELWKVAYGVWNFIKNSGRFPEAANLTLEWVGAIPGKRESRRFEGDYILCQQDIVEQRAHADAVSFGGWAIDLHPSQGVYSEKPGCTQWHSKGVYAIPYRCLYSRNISNLLLAGRVISASHVAFGSTRVMATCAHGGQAAGMAASLCLRDKVEPAGVDIAKLQRDLLRAGQYIPGLALCDSDDLARRARIAASSESRLSALEPGGQTMPLTHSWAMMLPVQAGPAPRVTVRVDARRATVLQAQLRISGKPGNHTPDVTLATAEIPLPAGTGQEVPLPLTATFDGPRYAFVCLLANEDVAVHLSERRITGVIAVNQKYNPAVAKSSSQSPPPGIGVDPFEFWCPARRPAGQNLAISVSPPLAAFGPENLVNGLARPIAQPNAWVADPADRAPRVTLRWEKAQTIRRIELSFDTDWDHPMESVQMGHPERVMPFCVRRFRILDAAGHELARCEDNHQTRRSIRLSAPAVTDAIIIEVDHPGPNVPAALFEVRCYET